MTGERIEQPPEFAERRAVVAWLRSFDQWTLDMPGAADAIERGEHLGVRYGPLDPIPQDVRRALPERERKLQIIGDIIAHWIKWVTGEREAEGLPTSPDTHIILASDGAPPHWPSVGQLMKWLEVIRTGIVHEDELKEERLFLKRQWQQEGERAERLQNENLVLITRYHELLYAVSHKHGDEEDRHATALRYIRERDREAGLAGLGARE